MCLPLPPHWQIRCVCLRACVFTLHAGTVKPALPLNSSVAVYHFWLLVKGIGLDVNVPWLYRPSPPSASIQSLHPPPWPSSHQLISCGGKDLTHLHSNTQTPIQSFQAPLSCILRFVCYVCSLLMKNTQ